MPVFAGTTALFFVAAAILGGFLFSSHTELERANNTIVERDSAIDANQKEIKELKTDLQSAEGQLEDKEGENATLAKDKEVIAQCLQLLIEFLDAAGAKDQATAEKKLKEMEQPCQQAQGAMN